MARENLQIAVVKYTGTGAAGRILDAGMVMPPVMGLVKRDGSANAEAVWKTNKMGALTAYLGTTASNLSNIFTQMLDTIVLGTSVNVNANTAGYYGLLIGARSAGGVFAGRYRGAGVGNVQSGHFPFEPEIVVGHVTNNAVNSGFMRTSLMSTANSLLLSNVNQANNLITAFLADGITVGNSTAVSAAANTYDYVAMRLLEGAIACGFYVGNGSSQVVPVPGMDMSEGCAILVKAAQQTTPTHALFATSEMVNVDGLQGCKLSASPYATDGVTAMSADGFTVGSSLEVNEDTRVYHFIAFKEGLYSVRPDRTAV